MCALCDDRVRDRPPPDNDLALLTMLVADPCATTGELTALLGLPDVPDDDGDADARD